MFRITAQYDDPWHPLQSDVVTVASVAEALAIIEDSDDNLESLAPGERCEAYGFGVTYTVERV